MFIFFIKNNTQYQLIIQNQLNNIIYICILIFYQYLNNNQQFIEKFEI